MKQKNIVLIGMSGAGKSTLGVLLAKALGKQFVDTDLIIQQKTGMLLQDFIDTQGVCAFMDAEEAIVSSLSLENTVIATGGSVVYSERAMKALKENGIAVYLFVEFHALEKRISNITTRGIVFKGQNDLKSVYNERLPLYEAYADITINSTNRDIEASVCEILAALNKL